MVFLGLLLFFQEKPKVIYEGNITLDETNSTINEDFFKELNYFDKIQENYLLEKFIVHGGEISRKQNETRILSWNKIDEI